MRESCVQIISITDGRRRQAGSVDVDTKILLSNANETRQVKKTKQMRVAFACAYRVYLQAHSSTHPHSTPVPHNIRC